MLSGLGIDEYFSRTTGAGTSQFLTDALGSTVALSDSSGVIQSSYNYDAFGSTTASGASSDNPFQFTGRENDGTGLYYYRARYYSPAPQRFATEDPLQFGAGDPNLHAYVGNGRTNWVDPTGLIKVSCSSRKIGD